MSKILQKFLVTIKHELGEALYNEEKIISIGLQDNEQVKKIYYMGKKAGQKEFKRQKINKKQYEELLNKATSIEVL